MIADQRELLTRLSPEECRRRIAERLIPTAERLALQARWQRPPEDRVVTGMVNARSFALRKTLPVYAYEPALWGQFEPTPAGTRITTYLVVRDSRWVILSSRSASTSSVRRLVGKAWLW